ncbi:MAG: polymer-forming cytoskeletal protein [Candidatus Hydrogenedentota bacterium]
MLEKKKLDENNVVTIIGPGTTITGEIESKGTVRVEGTVNGRIDCEDTIVIHESGHVKADLIAGQVIISGTVEGNTFAHDRLEVTNQGKIVGNITAPRISIAEGVIFEGQCTMKPQGQIEPPLKNGQAPKEVKEVKPAKEEAAVTN